MIIETRSTKEKTLFLSFYKWEEKPDDGGSAFKGSDRPFVCVRGTEDLSRRFIEGIDSQFEYEWKRGEHPDDIERLPETVR